MIPVENTLRSPIASAEDGDHAASTSTSTGPAAESAKPMWKGSSNRLELTDRPDFARTDLFTAFHRSPLGRHDVELQLLVSGVRGSSRIPRIALAQSGPSRWLVVQIPPQRGGGPTVLTRRVFDDLAEAERFVFDHRLTLLDDLDRERHQAGTSERARPCPQPGPEEAR